jgi:hypothetical protein
MLLTYFLNDFEMVIIIIIIIISPSSLTITRLFVVFITQIFTFCGLSKNILSPSKLAILIIFLTCHRKVSAYNLDHKVHHPHCFS